MLRNARPATVPAYYFCHTSLNLHSVHLQLIVLIGDEWVALRSVKYGYRNPTLSERKKMNNTQARNDWYKIINRTEWYEHGIMASIVHSHVRGYRTKCTVQQHPSSKFM